MLCTKCEGSLNSIALISLDLRDWLLSGDESQQSYRCEMDLRDWLLSGDESQQSYRCEMAQIQTNMNLSNLMQRYLAQKGLLLTGLY